MTFDPWLDPGDPAEPADAGRGTPTTRFTAPQGHWPVARLAARLFETPARWGWRAVEYREPDAVPDLAPTDPPAYTEPPAPDTSELRGARSLALWGLLGRIVLVLAAAVLLGTTEDDVRRFILDLEGMRPSDYELYRSAAGLFLGVLALTILPRIANLYRAIRDIWAFERPFRIARAAAEQRYAQALAEWRDAVERHARTHRSANIQRVRGPEWIPVLPAAEATRVDVVGGDPQRHGWAGLLVTLGSSVLAGGGRMVVLDLTGRDVGGGLLEVATTRGLHTQRIDLPADATDVNPLGGVPRQNLANCLAYALTDRPEGGDLRQERALAKEILQRVLDRLGEDVTLPRIAAGVRDLRDEVGHDAQDAWAVRQTRFVGGQLDLLAGVAAGGPLNRPLWCGGAVSLVTTAGGRDDRKDLLDRLLIGLAREGMHSRRRFADCLVVAGADHLGVTTLDMLADHGRTTGVQLILMIDQPQGDIERTVGTGGTVCVMKMYNHRDAAVAAEFIGYGHRFVVNQVTREVGSRFTSGGGDGFAAMTGRGSNAPPHTWLRRGPATELSESRGHTWTGMSSWALSDSVGTSTTSTRVYEFIVEPAQILGMPETAFILVDNSGSGRRIVMADSNPGICLLDRVALTAT